MNIENYLQELDEQNVQEESKILVVENPAVKEICLFYDEWDKKNNIPEFLLDIYHRGIDCLQAKQFTMKDVFDFSIFLKNYEQRKYFYRTGFFLSALIQTSKEENFEVHTKHLHEKLNYVGSFSEGKNLVVLGSSGFDTGHGLKSGRIIVKGDADTNLGASSEGGEIIVLGKIEDIGMGCKAKIYHRGELIHDGA